MRKLYVLIGKSASGKDSVYRNLLEDPALKLQPYIGYTTRPIRTGEQNGREYFFVSQQEMKDLEAAGQVIEKRVYHTVHGDWYYFSVDQTCREEGDPEEADRDYLDIGTLEAYTGLRNYFGADRVIPLYIEVDQGVRLQRALDREKSQESPRYAEMCRRFLLDEEDFSEDRIREAGITRRFENDQLDRCLQEIRDYILMTAQGQGTRLS